MDNPIGENKTKKGNTTIFIYNHDVLNSHIFRILEDAQTLLAEDLNTDK